MAAEGILASFGVLHAQISKLLTDDAANPAPTYDTPIDVPGIQVINHTSNFASNTLTGDDKTLDTQASQEAMEIEIEHGKLSHAVRAVLEGGTHTVSSTPANKSSSHLSIPGGAQPGKWKLEALVVNLDKPGEVLRQIYHKCTMTSSGIERSYGAHGTNTFSATATATTAGNLFYDEIEQEAGQRDDTGDTEALKVASSTPAHEATGIAVGADIDIVMNKPVDSDFLDTAFWTVYDVTNASSVAIATPTLATNTVTLNPSSDLQAAALHRVTVSAAVRDASGNPLGYTHEFTFTTA